VKNDPRLLACEHRRWAGDIREVECEEGLSFLG